MSVRSYQPQQFTLFFSNPKDILGENHLCFIVDDIVEHLNLSKLPNRKSTVGAPCYDYRILIKILFYGYATGTFSSRKLMSATQENIAYLYLTRQQAPNFRTISDFRKNYRIFLEESFVMIIKAAKEIGLIKLGTVSLDSTKIRANASSQKTFTQEELKEQKKRIEEAIDEAIQADEKEDALYGSDKTGNELPEEIKDREKRIKKIEEAIKKAEEDNKEKINLTDADAHYMKANGTIQTNYNCQLTVDSKANLILSNKTTTTVADAHEVKPQIETIEQVFKESPKELLADSGYYSIDNLVYLEDKHIIGYLPHQDDARDKKDKFKTKEYSFDKKEFKYNRQKDQYICPQGYILRKKTIQSKEKRTLYQCQDCHRCAKKELCLSGEARFRLISRYTNEALIIKMRNRLVAKKGKAKYAKRSHLAETPFAHFKKNLRFRQFLCRGMSAVATELNLLCIGYNIKKIAPLIFNPIKKMRFNLALS